MLQFNAFRHKPSEHSMSNLIDQLRAPGMSAVDIDGLARLEMHAAILARKRMLREVFSEFHRLFNQYDSQWLSGQGLRVEIGAGISPIKELYQDVLSTDVVPGKHLDLTIDAQAMAFEDESVRVLFGQNCFHHFPDPDAFLSEAERVLVPGGGVILLEPYHGPLASFTYKHLFHTEGFDKHSNSWQTASTGPMNGANQALSYVVFTRDRSRFENSHPRLRIVHQECMTNYLQYVLSGGLNFRQLAPDWASAAIRLSQWALSPLRKWLALHHMLVLRKLPE